MQRYARLSTTIIFGGVALSTTFLPLLFQTLPESNTRLLPKLPPALIFGVLWPPVVVAALLGAAFGSLFAITISLRLGAFYAACLGTLMGLPIPFVETLSRLKLDDFIFALTFMDFNKAASTVPVAIAQLSENNAAFSFWLPGPLTGVLVWAWLKWRRS